MDNNLQLSKLKKQIEVLKRKQTLSNCQEEKIKIEERLKELREEVKNLDRKQPNVVPVINVATVGDKMEAKLSGKARRSRSLMDKNVFL